MNQWNSQNRIGAEDYITIDELSAMSYITINDVPFVDVTSYVTYSYLESKHYLDSIPSEYITSDELDQVLVSYITQDELSANAYLTEHQSLVDYVTYEFLSSQSYLTEIPSYYITQDELSSNSYLTQHQDLSSYSTISYVTDSVDTAYTALQNYINTYFTRKPVVVWEATDSSQGLVALNTDLTDNPSWQLTGLDFSPFKKIKIYTKANQKTGTTASASTTAAMILEMSLDPRAAGPYAGHYVGSIISQKPNDNNRLATLTCAVSADKTSFVVLRMTNLYGTGATSNSDVNGYVFLIEGYYD